MNKALLVVSAIGISALAPTQQASAHVAYLDLLNNPAAVVTSNAGSSTYFYASAGALNGNFGWADAADGNQGNSHHGSWTTFDISSSVGAYVNISVFTDGFNAAGIPPRTSDFNPAFSIYSGLVPDMSHETYSFVAPGLGGAWNALGYTTMSNEVGETNTINYITHVGQDQNQLSTSIALNHFWLAQGTYTLVLGGDSAAALAASFTPDDDIDPRGYGISLTVTPGTQVAAVPVPGALWLFGTAVLGWLGAGRRKAYA